MSVGWAAGEGAAGSLAAAPIVPGCLGQRGSVVVTVVSPTVQSATSLGTLPACVG